MVVSDEPGFYKEGEFGIRIENGIMVVQHPELKEFYTFENLTTAPYCRELIDPFLINQSTLDNINSFHKKVYKTLKPFL